MPTTEAAVDPIVALTAELIRRPSVTPDDADCQRLIGERLQALGFTLEAMPEEDVDNLWAHRGPPGPTLVFAGHTDVSRPATSTPGAGRPSTRSSTTSTYTDAAPPT